MDQFNQTPVQNPFADTPVVPPRKLLGVSIPPWPNAWGEHTVPFGRPSPSSNSIPPSQVPFKHTESPNFGPFPTAYFSENLPACQTSMRSAETPSIYATAGCHRSFSRDTDDSSSDDQQPYESQAHFYMEEPRNRNIPRALRSPPPYLQYPSTQGPASISSHSELPLPTTAEMYPGIEGNELYTALNNGKDLYAKDDELGVQKTENIEAGELYNSHTELFSSRRDSYFSNESSPKLKRRRSSLRIRPIFSFHHHSGKIIDKNTGPQSCESEQKGVCNDKCSQGGLDSTESLDTEGTWVYVCNMCQHEEAACFCGTDCSVMEVNEREIPTLREIERHQKLWKTPKRWFLGLFKNGD
ncbi:uncharacterized protein K452DRAFT_355072 [Aplosporella prunicola CBS 121167]|uniref:Uncharacterized protein n=1 Tax=Aplosporella prunicola CBS 121167 TaxID=1176127 RepID=A0A6A6BT81_9PEZI|nr:uncharacterized protein K452DRAFT_355072 [Aplosporella prunicola CBS 121167]KAF2146593.1 hypothetical protein K452DRAFT_355072 [Aplosporella prunicola CBS 121167]